MELKQLLDQLWARRTLVLGTFATVVFAFILYLVFVQKGYKVTAQVFLRHSGAAPTLFQSLDLTLPPDLQESPNDTDQVNFVILATSKPNLKALIDRLDLKRDRALDYIFNKLFRLGVSFEKRKVTPEELRSPSVLLKLFFALPSVSVKQRGETDIFSVTARSSNPDEAMAIANTLAEVIVESQRDFIRTDFREARNLLLTNETKLDQVFEAVLAKAKAFKEGHISGDLDTEMQNLTTRLDTISSAHDENRVDLEKARADKNALLAQLDMLKQIQIANLSSPSMEFVESLKSQMLTQQLSLADYTTQYTAEHPKMASVTAQIKSIKDRLRMELSDLFQRENIIGGTSFDTFVERLIDSMATLTQLEAADQAYTQVEDRMRRELLDVIRNYYDSAPIDLKETSIRTLYQDYFDIVTRIDLLEIVAVSGVRVIEPATIPAKLRFIRTPNPVLVAFFGVLLGAFTSLALGLSAVFLDDTLQSSSQISGNTIRHLHHSIPFFPRVKKCKSDALMQRDDISTSFQKLAHEIDHRLPKQRSVLAITSILPHAGKTFVASALAAAMTRKGAKVGLIDLNFENSRLTTFHSGKPRHPDRDLDFQALRTPAGFPDLDLFPIAHTSGAPADALFLNTFYAFLDDLRPKYDILIIETSSLASPSNVLDIIDRSLEVICVVGQRTVSQSAFDAFAAAMHDCNHDNCSLLFNGCDGETFSAGLNRYRQLLVHSIFRRDRRLREK